MKIKITKINDNNLKAASKFSCCLDHVQIYAIYVQPNHVSVVDALVYHEFLLEHLSDWRYL